MKKTFLILAAAAVASAIGFAQSSSARQQLARGREAWDQRLTKTAIEAVQEAHALAEAIYRFADQSPRPIRPVPAR